MKIYEQIPEIHFFPDCTAVIWEKGEASPVLHLWHYWSPWKCRKLKSERGTLFFFLFFYERAPRRAGFIRCASSWSNHVRRICGKRFAVEAQDPLYLFSPTPFSSHLPHPHPTPFFFLPFFAASVSLIGSGESEIAWDDLHFSPVAVNTCVLLLLCVSRCLSSLSKRAFGFWPVFLLPGWKRAIRVKRFVFRQLETLSWITSERLCPCPCHRLLCRFNRCCHSVLRFQRFLSSGPSRKSVTSLPYFKQTFPELQ